MAASKLSFDRVETGRVRGAGEEVLGIDGYPEVEYVLHADVDGVKVPILTKPGNYVLTLRDKAKRDEETAKAETDDTATETGDES